MPLESQHKTGFTIQRSAIPLTQLTAVDNLLKSIFSPDPPIPLGLFPKQLSLFNTTFSRPIAALIRHETSMQKATYQYSYTSFFYGLSLVKHNYDVSSPTAMLVFNQGFVDTFWPFPVGNRILYLYSTFQS